nr:MAG TPA: hypothetical protein [Caudoviricetes sp.]
MNQAYQDLVRQRVRSSDRAFQAIEESRKILSQLEAFVVVTAAGGAPDIKVIAQLSHDLRGNVDELLVGLVEARAQSGADIVRQKGEKCSNG